MLQVMIQPHNRKMSFSLYMSALAVADTIVVLTGKFSIIRGFHKRTTLAIMPILASEALLHENKKNPVTKCYPQWV